MTTRQDIAEAWELEAALRELTRRVIELSSALSEAEGRIAALGRPKHRNKPQPPKRNNAAGVARPIGKRTRLPVPKIAQPPKPVFDFAGEDLDLPGGKGAL